MTENFTLISHALCPYVQRTAIVLAEKEVDFKRIDIDLSNKPDWFLKISPLGKTPVLLVDEVPIFESAVICEYLDDTLAPRLHPDHALLRAQHRAWMQFGSDVLNTIGSLYTAADDAVLRAQADVLQGRFAQLEAELGAGPYFAGESFGMVDAVFGPVFRYFDVFESIDDFGFFDGLPRVSTWRTALAARASVRAAVRPDYPDLLRTFLQRRGSALSRRMAPVSH